MPINIPDRLPARDVLGREGIFVMQESRAIHQDVRPLRLAILNLMPLKMATEVQLFRLLSNTPLQVEIQLLKTKSYTPTHTSAEHLETFYKTFDAVRHRRHDGLLITGAPVEHIDFEAVEYWSEITEIMDWAQENATSTLYICWAAQAALYHYYDVPKHPLERKLFGVYHHSVNTATEPIVRGFDDRFYAPHSRHTEIRREDVADIGELSIVSESERAGVYLITSKDGSKVFVTGHSEYDPLTLKEEYERDKAKGLPIDIPEHYYRDDDPSLSPLVRWRSHSFLLFSNWLNYYVYQETPFEL